MIKIYADFNNCDEHGAVRLNGVGSLIDVEKYRGILAEGIDVLLYMTDEFEVTGKLVIDDGVWKGVTNWETICYSDS